MSIGKLASSTSRLLTSSCIVPSFEDGIETVLQNSLHTRPDAVTVSIQPDALRFTVVDKGPGLSEADFRLALRGSIPPDAELAPALAAISALAATSAVELRVRTERFVAIKVVRASQILEERFVDIGQAESVLKSAGMQIEVWETFTATPVRRRIEQSRTPNSIARVVRDRVAAIAVANPRTAISLRIANGIMLLRTPRGFNLTMDHVRMVISDSRAHFWCNVVVEPEQASLTAFFARSGLPHSRAQFVSVDGIPTPHSWLHRTIARVWRTYLNHLTESNNPVKRLPAYVINISTRPVPRHTIHRITSPMKSYTSHDPPDRSSEALIVTTFLDALCGKSRKTVNRDHENTLVMLPKPKVLPQKNLVSYEEKVLTGRTTMTKRKRFEDAEISWRKTKFPRSAWSVNLNKARESPEETIQHFGAEKLRVSASAIETPWPARMVSSKREVNAKDVESVYKRELPGWCNPCLKSLPKNLQQQKPKSGSVFPSQIEIFDKKRVRVKKKILDDLRIVGQVENKFIVVASEAEDAMYALDQHAVSERVLYERMLRKASSRGITSATLDHPKKVTLSPVQRDVLLEKRGELEKWGWTIALTKSDDLEAQIIQVPMIHGISGQDIKIGEAEQFRNFLDSLIDGAVACSLPRPILEAIACAACHSAVRFGDHLSRKQCESLVLSLRECDNPFVCAHGRPSIVPLVVFDSPERFSK